MKTVRALIHENINDIDYFFGDKSKTITFSEDDVLFVCQMRYIGVPKTPYAREYDYIFIREIFLKGYPNLIVIFGDEEKDVLLDRFDKEALQCRPA